MKKTIALILTLIFLFALCACDGGEDPKLQKYAVTVKETKVEIDAEAAAVLQSLGEWTTYDESPSCAFEGLDKIYGYGAFDILTYPLNGKDYVSGIYLNDDSYTTEEGIALGADKDAVIQAYGEADSQSDTYLRYEGDGMSLTFLLKDGRVTNIQYAKNT
jgi:hypothetical protein